MHKKLIRCLVLLLCCCILAAGVPVQTYALFNKDDSPEDIASEYGWDVSLYDAEEYTYHYSTKQLGDYSPYANIDVREQYPDGQDITFDRASKYGWDYYNDIVKTTKEYLGIQEFFGMGGGGYSIAALALREWELCEEEIANGQSGQRRETGGDNNVIYSRYWNCAGSAWCAMFVAWCMDQLGFTDGVTYSANPAADYLFGCGNEFRWLTNTAGFEYYTLNELSCFGGSYTPCPGDVIIFDDASGTNAHTGIVVECATDSFTTVEGNCGNRVAKTVYTMGVFRSRHVNCKVVHVIYPMSDGPEAIYSFLCSQFNETAALAVMGCMALESGWTFSATCLEEGYQQGYGLLQWTDNPSSGLTRHTQLNNWCKSNGYDPDTVDGQLHFLLHELQDVAYYRPAYNALKSSESLLNMQTTFSIYYMGGGTFNSASAMCRKYYYPNALIIQQCIAQNDWTFGGRLNDTYSMRGR